MRWLVKMAATAALIVGVGMGCGAALDVHGTTPVDSIVTDNIIIGDAAGPKLGWENKTITITIIGYIDKQNEAQV